MQPAGSGVGVLVLLTAPVVPISLFSTSLPFHEIEHESLLEVVTAILSAPATWFALLIVGLGFVIAYIRMKGFKYFGGGLLQPFVDTAFGFEPVNNFLVQVVSKFAERLCATQTGELNWNILGIIGGLLVGGGFVVASLSTNYWVWIVGFGVLVGKDNFRLLSGQPKIFVKTAENGNQRWKLNTPVVAPDPEEL